MFKTWGGVRKRPAKSFVAPPGRPLQAVIRARRGARASRIIQDYGVNPQVFSAGRRRVSVPDYLSMCSYFIVIEGWSQTSAGPKYWMGPG